jgi:hypothetical protein
MGTLEAQTEVADRNYSVRRLQRGMATQPKWMLTIEMVMWMA